MAGGSPPQQSVDGRAAGVGCFTGEGERVALLIFKCDNSAFGSFQGRR